jgi:predicted nucleic acid-binding Zn ribbon protein
MPETATKKPLKLCLECGEPLGPGRGDRKFCNDLCRTAFNNRRRKEPIPDDEFSYFNNVEMPAIKKVYNILLDNWTIMYNIGQYDGAILPLRDLLGHGFNLKYFTSECKFENGEVYRFCFDFGYRMTNDEQVYIIYRREEIFIV